MITTRKGQNVLLIIAHPDDEAMFFVPTILSLQRAEQNVFVLCFSNGDFIPGQGLVRERELIDSCVRLGIPAECVSLAQGNHRTFPDGPQHHWGQAAIADALDTHLHFLHTERGREIHSLVSFDEEGISGHPNHRALYSGIVFWRARSTFQASGSAELAADQLGRADITCWKLVTTNRLRKYTGIFDVLLSWIFSVGLLFLFYPRAFFSVWASMRAHASQFVWFRVFFVLFSRYSYMNTLERVF